MFAADPVCRYEAEKLARAFFPFEKFTPADALGDGEDSISVELVGDTARVFARYSGRLVSESRPVPAGADDHARELAACTALYKALCGAAGYTLPWGLLTGVRPAKLFGRLRESGGEGYAKSYFADTLLVSPGKVELCSECSKNEDAIIARSTDKSYSLYVSIPFCPSRCGYCSFVSHSIAGAGKLLPDYLKLLSEELRATASAARDLGLTLSTVYVGGGTPSVLSAEQTADLLREITSDFPTRGAAEFTFEAGRPETITREKLEVLREYGVTRISVNPQTLHDSTLAAVGRRHTVADFYRAFSLAREAGFGNINTDLIAGLPGEDAAMFRESVEGIARLSPESVTVHSLAAKRAAALGRSPFENAAVAGEMVDFARERLAAVGYFPYYMYRQSKTVGNLENVGYAKPGREGLYNVYMMDETHTVLSCGAGAVTKLKAPGKNIIRRVFNFKYPYEYIRRFPEIISRKSEITEFYSGLGETIIKGATQNDI